MSAVEDRAELGDVDLYLFNEGNHFRLYEKLGAHPHEGGTTFAVWAPAARSVAVIGDFNGWDADADVLSPVAASGIWRGFVEGARAGHRYKYAITPPHGGERVERADPLAFAAEVPPRTASVICAPCFPWCDEEWMDRRRAAADLRAPISIYEVHAGSWRRRLDGGPLSYRELAEPLAEHACRLGFTHVEFLPLTEHPFYGSWGYQTTGYFSPTSRYGSPEDFMYLVDHLHRSGIGVILDWVPSHFPTDAHGLANFDGTHVYEHADPREGFHPDWNSAIFNYGRHEVRSFLVSSAFYWLDRFHVDGLRVDAVASMLYRDYSRREGEWIPNRYGGRENLEAIDFLRRLNDAIYTEFPDVQTIAEESTAWPMVSRPTTVGGLGFGLKWDMGWMHDSLEYFRRDPIHRRHHQGDLTFRSVYAFTENFVLPLSHDEVVHLKGSLLGQMAGDEWQKFANLRLLYAWQFGQPGKKLLFMGSEIAPWTEWNHDRGLEWHIADHPTHAGIQRLVADLNHLYRRETSLHELDCDPAGFAWIAADDVEASVLSFVRRSTEGRPVVCAYNATPVPRPNYRIGVPQTGHWDELLDTDAEAYGGSGTENRGGVESTPIAAHGHPQSIVLTLPPLAAVFLAPAGA